MMMKMMMMMMMMMIENICRVNVMLLFAIAVKNETVLISFRNCVINS
jgi:hypothetical protein